MHDRELAADAAILVRDIEGYEGVRLSTLMRVIVCIRGELERVRAIARLTALDDGGLVTVVDADTAERFGGPFVTFSDPELAAASLRARERLDAWSKVPINDEAARGRYRFLLVSRTPQDAKLLREAFGETCLVRATASLKEAESAFIEMFPNMLILDSDLWGARDFADHLRELYPSRCTSQNFHWYKSSQGLFVEMIRASPPSAAYAPQAGCGSLPKTPQIGDAILVMNRDADLVSEIRAAAPHARVDHARDTWEALEMLHAKSYGLFVVGAVTADESAPQSAWVVRGAARLESPPEVIVATDAPTSQRMASSRPSVGHRFVARPIDAASLAAARSPKR